MRRTCGTTIGLAAAFAALLAHAGCATNAACEGCDGAGEGGSGGQAGSGGSGGHLDAGTGAGGEQAITTGCDADTKTDPKNCGECGQVCQIPNAFPSCSDGHCGIASCAPAFLDRDGVVANGCEYPCATSNGGVEACDGLDNDCNGEVDELTDKSSDAAHCGACGHVCQYSNATGLCAGGVCAMGPCFVGFSDLDGSDADGCEYACTPTNGGVEVCDNTDNDCDAELDEGFDTSSDPQNCGTCGNDCSVFFPHTTPVCAAGLCQLGPCVPGFLDADGIAANGCEYGCAPTNGGVEICDGLDNDCNGAPDDGALPGVGEVCGGSSVGVCKQGIGQCAAGSMACVGGVEPGAEICDTLDNDCDGQDDEGCPVVAVTDTRLDRGAGSNVGQAPSTQLSVAARGDLIVAAYLDRRAGNADIRASVSQDGGLTWPGAADLGVATAALGEVDPSVAVGLAGAYVAYAYFTGPSNRDVYLGRAEPPFSSFAVARADKDPIGTDAFFVRAVVAKPGAPDALVVVWESLIASGGTTITDVWLQASLDGGLTWRPKDLQVNAVTGFAEQPVLATDDAGRAFVAWRDRRSGKWAVYADVFDVATGKLGGNHAVSGGQAAQEIAIAADAGGPNVYVAWTDLRAATRAIRLNRSTNGGSSYQPDGQVVNVDSTFADASAPALASRAGFVAVAWEDTRSGLSDVRVNTSMDAGATWRAASSLADRGGKPGANGATGPRIALGASDRVLVAWEDARSGQRDIYANHSADHGATFQPLELRLDVGAFGAPSPAGFADSRSPFLVTDASGARGVAVWLDYRTVGGITGANADVYANTFQ